MITRLKLKPGQKGTKSLVEKYGEALVCVRYRYDEVSRTRIKTVELIVEKKELPSQQKRIDDDALVPVQIAYAESALKNMAKTLGGDGIQKYGYGTSRSGKSRGRNWKSI